MTSPNTIQTVRAWEALDSRGRPTVACRVELTGGSVGRAIVPSGASTGQHEARERRDGGERYDGWGVLDAVDAVNTVYSPLVAGMRVDDRTGIDRLIEEQDGDDALATYGANAALAVSLVVTIANAESRRQPLWATLVDGQHAASVPLPMVNIFSGGAHAGRAVDIQDFLAVPVGAGSFAEAMEWIARVRRKCADLLDRAGGWSALVADEGGLSARFDDNERALRLLADGIDAAGFGADSVSIALDIAASQLSHEGHIVLAGQGERLSVADWIERIVRWTKDYPIVSIEDPVDENDWDGAVEATRRLPGVQLLGDDLFATNASRVEAGIAKTAANAVLIKVNQAGTVSRAENVLRLAQRAGLATVVSARSGDTEDSWLADLAVGWGARQIKVGSTMRGERTAKWNRLLELEALDGLPFAGREGLASSR